MRLTTRVYGKVFKNILVLITFPIYILDNLELAVFVSDNDNSATIANTMHMYFPCTGGD